MTDGCLTVEDLFLSEWGRLVGLARLLLDEPGDAEEVVQEAFARLIKSSPALRDPARAPAWLRTTVMNLARARLRRRVVASRHAPMPEPPGAPPDDRVLVDDDRRQVVAALQRLAHRQRQCIVLRYWAELTDREIAQALRISKGSVKQHLHRGMATLATALEEAR